MMRGIWNEFRRLQNEMDSLFGNMVGTDSLFDNSELLEDRSYPGKALANTSYRQPSCNMYETENSVVTEIEMPGVNKKDIKINLEKDRIEVKSETNTENKHEDKDKKMYRYERSYSGFYRQFRLPEYVDSDKAKAEYKNGILKITVPKKKELEKKKKYLEIE